MGSWIIDFLLLFFETGFLYLWLSWDLELTKIYLPLPLSARIKRVTMPGMIIFFKYVGELEFILPDQTYLY